MVNKIYDFQRSVDVVDCETTTGGRFLNLEKREFPNYHAWL